jgi:SNF2 family DNA or RNA helicase
MQIIDNAAVQFPLPVPVANLVAGHVERSELLQQKGDTQDLLICWDHAELVATTSIVTRHGDPNEVNKLPSPILRDYNWPGVYRPMAHQKDTASFLSIRQRAFCFNEAGTGKTSAAIWAADYLMDLGVVRRVLVICPLSIMQSAWQADIFKTAMHRSCGIAYGSAEKRKKIIQANYDFIVINYDGTGIVLEEIKKGKFDLIIVDEANEYKNAGSKRWKTLAKMIDPSTWLWMMTGTPASQSPLDAFGLARLVAPERIPKFSTAWRDKVMQQITRFKWVPKKTAKEDVFNALQPAIRYTKNECLDLPSVTYQTRDVPMTAQAAKYYNILKKQLLIEAVGETVSAVTAAVSMNKLLQISGGAVYTDEKDVIDFDITPRLRALEEVLDETSNKALVFVPFVHTIPIIAQFLGSKGIPNEIIQGNVSVGQRQSIFSKFQREEHPKVLIIQPQSARHGVTLTAADTVVFWGPVMSVETYIQCIGRIDRVGQKNKMTVVHLEGSEVERKLYSMLQGKVYSHQKIVDLYKRVIEEE